MSVSKQMSRVKQSTLSFAPPPPVPKDENEKTYNIDLQVHASKVNVWGGSKFGKTMLSEMDTAVDLYNKQNEGRWFNSYNRVPEEKDMPAKEGMDWRSSNIEIKDHWLMPTSVDELVGNRRQIEEIDRWVGQWTKKPLVLPRKCVMLVRGKPGVGKTSAVRLVLHKHKFTNIVEINASEIRSKRLITDRVEPLILNSSVSSKNGRTAIVLEEVDGLHCSNNQSIHSKNKEKSKTSSSGADTLLKFFQSSGILPKNAIGGVQKPCVLKKKSCEKDTCNKDNPCLACNEDAFTCDAVLCPSCFPRRSFNCSCKKWNCILVGKHSDHQFVEKTECACASKPILCKLCRQHLDSFNFRRNKSCKICKPCSTCNNYLKPTPVCSGKYMESWGDFRSTVPIIMLANTDYQPFMKSLEKVSLCVKFFPVSQNAIRFRLFKQLSLKRFNIFWETWPETNKCLLDVLVEHTDGDMRKAILLMTAAMRASYERRQIHEDRFDPHLTIRAEDCAALFGERSSDVCDKSLTLWQVANFLLRQCRTIEKAEEMASQNIRSVPDWLFENSPCAAPVPVDCERESPITATVSSMRLLSRMFSDAELVRSEFSFLHDKMTQKVHSHLGLVSPTMIMNRPNFFGVSDKPYTWKPTIKTVLLRRPEGISWSVDDRFKFQKSSLDGEHGNAGLTHSRALKERTIYAAAYGLVHMSDMRQYFDFNNYVSALKTTRTQRRMVFKDDAVVAYTDRRRAPTIKSSKLTDDDMQTLSKNEPMKRTRKRKTRNQRSLDAWMVTKS